MIGADVVNLYGNLNKTSISKSVLNAALEMPLYFQKINYTKGLRYLAMQYTPEKLALIGLASGAPKRRSSSGAIPDVTNYIIL